MISPSSLVSFWVLYPCRNPPPRTGISRESGSVRLRTGPGPLRLRCSRSGRPVRCACAARAFAASHLGLGFLDPAVVIDPGRAGRGGGCPAAYRSSSSASSRGPGRLGPGPAFSSASSTAADGRRAPGPLPGPLPLPVRLRPRVLRRLGGLPLRLQAGQRRGDPLIPRPRPPRLLAAPHPRAGPPRTAHLRPHRPPRAPPPVSAASFRPAPPRSGSPPSTRSPAIFIPSSATIPSLPIPSRAHSTSTCAKNSAAASGKAPGTGRTSHDRAGSPRRSPGTPHPCPHSRLDPPR